MSSSSKHALEPLRARAIDAATKAFESDLIEVEELETRLLQANEASSDTELRALIAESVPPHPRLTQSRPEYGNAVAIMGGVERRGSWTVPESLRVVAVMGGVDLDLREARLGDYSELEVYAFMGSIEIVVPPDVRLEVEGMGIMGAVEDRSEVPEETEGLPIVRVRGLAVMGSVEIRTRLPGESERDAKRRRRKLGSGKPR